LNKRLFAECNGPTAFCNLFLGVAVRSSHGNNGSHQLTSPVFAGDPSAPATNHGTIRHAAN
jgi:hypothetical protein